MKSMKFEGCNQTFGPPEGWSDEECFSVHAQILEGPKGMRCIRTKWIPSEKELKDLVEGRGVMLEFIGMFPPVIVFTLDDNGKPSFIDDPDATGSDLDAEKKGKQVKFDPKRK